MYQNYHFNSLRICIISQRRFSDVVLGVRLAPHHTWLDQNDPIPSAARAPPFSPHNQSLQKIEIKRVDSLSSTASK
jgi:hypothetical protein